MKTVQEASMEYIEKEIKKARNSLAQAERRTGVTTLEILNIENKIKILEFLSYAARVTDIEEGQVPLN